jgi:hypothetical protein
MMIKPSRYPPRAHQIETQGASQLEEPRVQPSQVDATGNFLLYLFVCVCIEYGIADHNSMDDQSNPGRHGHVEYI